MWKWDPKMPHNTHGPIHELILFGIGYRFPLYQGCRAVLEYHGGSLEKAIRGMGHCRARLSRYTPGGGYPNFRSDKEQAIRIYNELKRRRPEKIS